MRPILRFIASLVLATAAACTAAPGKTKVAPARVPELQPAAPPSYPVAPAQHEPWTAPRTALPDVLVSATGALFELGVADPRGLPYRALQLRVGSVWGGDDLLETHGWVLPGEKPTHAVAWNGLVYRVSKAGAAADLEADVEAMVAADEARRATYKKDNPDSDYYRFRHAWEESISAGYTELLPIRTALLLRLGHGTLAESTWGAWTHGMAANTNDDSVHLNDPYLMLATDWLWAMFDRAVCAHMRGDDEVALESVRQLALWHPEAEAKALERKFEPNEQCNEGTCEATLFFSFLEPLGALLADQERRATQGSVAVPDPAAAKTDAERIAARIAALDGVAARQWGQPGGVNLGSDPVVAALVEEGDAAVEPLLAVLETDPRLTRSVHFWRDFSRHRSVLGVHEAAYAALVGILKTSFFAPAATGDDLSARGMEGRKAVAAAIREYWTKYGAMSIEQRWYAALQSGESPQHWLQAAANIVRPADVTVSGGWVTTPARKPGHKIVLSGEPLRPKTAPSVTQLMIRRIADLGKPRPQQGGYDPAITETCVMAEHLAAWDPAGGLATFQTLMRQQVQQNLDLRDDFNREYLAICIAQMTVARAKAGDAAATKEYADWITAASAEQLGSNVGHALVPMHVLSGDPHIDRAARALFTGARSRWLPLLRPKGARHNRVSWVLDGRVLEVPAVRTRIRHELTDTNPFGSWRAKSGGIVEVKASGDNGWAMSMGFDPKDPDVPKPEASGAVRYCDALALQVAGKFEGYEFQVYWPRRRRDAAIADLRARLSKPTPDSR